MLSAEESLPKCSRCLPVKEAVHNPFDQFLFQKTRHDVLLLVKGHKSSVEGLKSFPTGRRSIALQSLILREKWAQAIRFGINADLRLPLTLWYVGKTHKVVHECNNRQNSRVISRKSNYQFKQI